MGTPRVWPLSLGSLQTQVDTLLALSELRQDLVVRLGWRCRGWPPLHVGLPVDGVEQGHVPDSVSWALGLRVRPGLANALDLLLCLQLIDETHPLEIEGV